MAARSPSRCTPTTSVLAGAPSTRTSSRRCCPPLPPPAVRPPAPPNPIPELRGGRSARAPAPRSSGCGARSSGRSPRRDEGSPAISASPRRDLPLTSASPRSPLRDEGSGGLLHVDVAPLLAHGARGATSPRSRRDLAATSPRPRPDLAPTSPRRASLPPRLPGLWPPPAWPLVALVRVGLASRGAPAVARAVVSSHELFPPCGRRTAGSRATWTSLWSSGSGARSPSARGVR